MTAFDPLSAAVPPRDALPDLTEVERWRLLLGEAGEMGLRPPSNGVDTPTTRPHWDTRTLQMDEALSWLYGRDDPAAASPDSALERMGGQQGGSLTVPEWINQVHTLFPKDTIERLERDALERYHINDLVTNPEVLARATPNFTLLKAVMQTKHLMNPTVLAMARELVAKVVADLIAALSNALQQTRLGRRQRQHLRLQGAAHQFAMRPTVQRNLQHYRPEQRKLIIHQAFFYSNTRHTFNDWQIVLLVDQSGSMVGSVIHAAVTASCLWALPGVKTHLIAFDTELVDLSEAIDDPVDTLMRVQLGGGTDIGLAVRYASQLIAVPKRAIVVVISDFYEGGTEQVLVDQVGALVAQGTQVLGLAALDEQADPCYDRNLAARLMDVGAHIGAMTPGQLAVWLAEAVHR